MDLKTDYLGLELSSPIVASASPLTRDVGGIRRLEDLGAAAVVLPSLFEEHIELEGRQIEDLDGFGESTAEATSYFPKTDPKMLAPDEYLETIRSAKEAVKIPVIASLNGITGGGWTRYASLIEEAGADALELNVYLMATNPEWSGADVEMRYLDAVRAVVKQVNIPVAVKMGPFVSALPHLANWFAREGVRGLVMFNRFYQPDIDLETLEVVPGLTLSRSEDLRLPLRWTAILHGRQNLDLAVTTGVHTHIDALKAVMAGANVTMMASELLQNGIGRIPEILRDMVDWMEVHEYDSIRQMRGSMSQKNVADPAVFERANYMKVLYSYRPKPTEVPTSGVYGRKPGESAAHPMG